MSRYELIWLYYNCLSHYGDTKFKELIEDYALLKNIRVELLTLSRELSDILQQKSITEDMLLEQKFSCTDFEYRLSDEKRNKDKYYIGAFYNKRELGNGKELVARWGKFMDEIAKKEETIETQKELQAFPLAIELYDDDDEFICGII